MRTLLVAWLRAENATIIQRLKEDESATYVGKVCQGRISAGGGPSGDLGRSYPVAGHPAFKHVVGY